MEALKEAGPAALARMRAEGLDPSKTPQALRRLGTTQSRRRQDELEWNRSDPELPDRREFVESILPGLRDLPLGKLIEATGLSLRYCSLVKRGLTVPHPRHWEALGRLASHGTHEGSGAPQPCDGRMLERDS